MQPLSDIDNTAKHNQSRRFLESTDYNFPSQIVEDPTKDGVLIDFILRSMEGLVRDVKVGCRHGYSDHEIGE